MITAFGELGVSITSTYIGHQGLDTLAAHLRVMRKGRERKQIGTPGTRSPSPMRASGAFSTTRSKSKKPSSPARAARSAVDVASAALGRAALV